MATFRVVSIRAAVFLAAGVLSGPVMAAPPLGANSHCDLIARVSGEAMALRQSGKDYGSAEKSLHDLVRRGQISQGRVDRIVGTVFHARVFSNRRRKILSIYLARRTAYQSCRRTSRS